MYKIVLRSRNISFHIFRCRNAGDYLSFHHVLRYLLNQLKLAAQGSESIFVPTSSNDTDLENLYSVKSGVTFHFFSTQIPCKYSLYFCMQILT